MMISMKYLFLIFILPFTITIKAFDLNTLKQQLKNTESIQGEFIQTRHLYQLPQALKTTGQFTLLRDKGLFWQIIQPFPLNIRLRDDGIAQQDEQGKWHISNQHGQAQQIALFMALLSGDTTTLSEQFELYLSGEAENWQLSLKPKSHILQQVFTEIRLKGGNFIQQIEIVEKQGDYSIIIFSQQKLNVSPNSAAYQALTMP